jgi:hypothetical protein
MLPLLAATPGLSGITDAHGRNEKGLDIIFFEESEIKKTCYGLQLKQGDISGGGTGRQTVKQIVDQLELAKDLVHPVAVDHVGRFQIERFIVATSGKISETARDEIASRFEQIPVIYWDGVAIARRINQHMPDLFSLADPVAVAYLKAVTARYDTLEALDQIPGVARRTLTQIYEEPSLRRKFDPAVAGPDAGPEASVTVPALKLGDLGKNSVIIADQDAGKTCLLRMLLLKRARDILSVPNKPPSKGLPILIRAKEILEKGNVTSALTIELARNGVGQLQDSIATDLRDGRYLLMIDGFSELVREEMKDRCETLILEFANSYPRILTLLSARPPDFVTPKHFQAFRHYVIQDFDQRQVASLLDRWTSDSPSLADVARRLTRRVREALQLPGSPISATIGVMLYEKERRYITNIAEAVDRYMVIRLGRYAHELGIKQEVEWTRKQDLLAEVAFSMTQDELDTLPERIVIERFNEAFARLGEDPQGDTVLGELVESGVLVREGDTVGFYRPAMRDFFAAHAINQRQDRDAFVRDVFIQRKWGLPIVFAAGLRRKNNELLRTLLSDVTALRHNAVGAPSSDYFYGAYLLGRILSNSEFSVESARLDVLKSCLSASVLSMPEFIETAKAQFGNIGEVAALIGLEYSFFATVGVPWLKNQFKGLLGTDSLAEEEQYLVASTYANLGLPGCGDILKGIASRTTSTRVLLVLKALVSQIREERNLTPGERAKFKKLEARLKKRLAHPDRQAELRELVKFKSRAVELEIKRIERLSRTK